MAQVKKQQLLKHATLYVSLEPCNHHGKTPPCTALIIKSGIKKVIIGCADPFEQVNGKGIEALKEAGCNVQVGVLEAECKWINRRFFTFHQKKRPYILLKWAQSEDGFIDKIRKEGDVIQPNWISNIQSRQMAHQWRAEEQAILVGTKTVLNDNPKLNLRYWEGEDPIKLVIDRNIKLPTTSAIFSGKGKTVVFSGKEAESKGEVEQVQLDFSSSIPKQIGQYLYDINVQSVIVEGGAFTLQSFIDENLWDEAQIFKGPVLFKEGVKAPNLEGETRYTQKIIESTLTVKRNLHA